MLGVVQEGISAVIVPFVGIRGGHDIWPMAFLIVGLAAMTALALAQSRPKNTYHSSGAATAAAASELPVTFHAVWTGALYGSCYAALLLGLAIFVFRRRDLK